jgi:trimeric autotransporter adhesin
MKRNVFAKICFSMLLMFVFTMNVKAQEVEVTSDDLWLTSKNSYGYIRFMNSGELLLNRNYSSLSNLAFTINVANSNMTALRIITNWTSPAKFEVLGTGVVTASGVALTSDSTEKANIQNIESPIDNIKKLNAVSYNWKDQKERGNKKSYGLLAQDLEKVYPDMVYTNDSGVKAIFYTELIPVLLEAIKEQQTKIEEQEKRLLDIETRLSKLEKKTK